LTPETVERFRTARAAAGEEIGATSQGLFEAVPDSTCRCCTSRQTATDVFVRWHLTGTHTGTAWAGLDPTGARITLDGIDHFVVRDGKIVSNFVVFDQMEVGRAMGLLPPDGSAPDRALKAAFNTKKPGGGQDPRGALLTVGHTVVRLDDVDHLDAGGAGIWRPIRRALGVTAFGINAYTADQVGAELIERHDEKSPGAGGHEEVYLVLAGRAVFTVAGEAIDAPAGTLLLVQPGTERAAEATEAGTTVLVIGGRPGARAAGLALRALVRRGAVLRGR
jgi:hypothetical protein